MAKLMNGSVGTGNGTGAEARLRKLLAYHEGLATAIRITLGALHGDQVTAKQQRAPDVVSQAIALDEARRGKVKRRRTGAYTKAAKQAQRGRTAAFLDAIAAGKMPPRVRANNALIGNLINNGYIVKKGDGYARTKKEFTA